MREVRATPEEVMEWLRYWSASTDLYGDDIDMDSLRFAMQMIIPVFAEYVERTRPNSRPTWR